MARPINESKLLAIKKATRDIVLEQGIGGASISKIAKRAKASEGYLYRHYESKRMLIESLFSESTQVVAEMLSEHISNKHTIKEIINDYARHIYDVAENELRVVLFQHKLLSDFSFKVPPKGSRKIKELCEELLEIGSKTGEINPNISPEQFYMISIGSILGSINIRARGFFNTGAFTDKEINQIVELILKALK